MTDILERLHNRARFGPNLDDNLGIYKNEGLLLEAADEIRRLRRIEAAYNELVRAENDLLRARARL